MAEERVVMFDKFSLAEVFAKVLSTGARISAGRKPGRLFETSSTVTVKTALIEVFPWLSNYHICQDGNDYRWKAWDDRDDESAIVYTKLVLCTKQVRDWILRFVEEGGERG